MRDLFSSCKACYPTTSTIALNTLDKPMVEFYWAPKAYLTHRTSRDSRLISSISVYKKDLIPTVIERSEIAK